jgi:uncharacterized membrane protein
MPPAEGPSPSVSAIYDTKILSLVTLVAAAYLPTALVVGGVPQLLLGLFVLLVAPGYAIAAMLFGISDRFPVSVHAALIVALAVVFDSAVGTVYFVAAPRVPDLALFLGMLTTVLCLAATAIQVVRKRDLDLTPVGGGLRRTFELPGFSRGQKVAAFALLGGILVTFGAIGYLSTIHPEGPPPVSVALLGPDGTTNTLPTGGSTDQVLDVLIVVGNNLSAQSLNLEVASTLTGVPPVPPANIPWSMPLRLGSGTESSTELGLAGGESQTVPVEFVYGASGSYVLTFAVQTLQGATLASATLGMTIR